MESPRSDQHHSRKCARLVPKVQKGPTAMLTYDELVVELASLCARNARITTSKDVADELWRMAREYRDQAARLGEAPELGDKSAAAKVAR